MRVLMIGTRYDLPRQLVESGEVELYVLVHPASRPDLENEGICSGVFDYESGPKLSVRAILQVRRVLATVKPELVHAFYGRALAHALLASTWMNNPPPIVSFRGVMTSLSRFDPSNWITYLHPRIAGHACESNAVKQGLVSSGIDPDTCVTTYNSIPIGRFPRPGRVALHPWGIPDDAFVVGSVANMRRVKGMDLLLRAAVGCADLKNVYWVLIGAVLDPRVSKLAQQPTIRDRVRLLGYRRDAAALMSGLDLFVMPSRSEGLCQALLEAMSQGVCPVVSDAGGMKEVVRDGRDGIVVPKEDVSALANAIRDLYDDRAKLQTLAQSAQRRVHEFGSAERMSERLLHLYKQVMGQVPDDA